MNEFATEKLSIYVESCTKHTLKKRQILFSSVEKAIETANTARRAVNTE